jgi:uncharacterized membrane protein
MENENLYNENNETPIETESPNLIARFLSAICYLTIFCSIPLILKTKNDYVGFHARQGLVLLLTEVFFVLLFIIPFIGWIIGFFGLIACAVFSLIGLVKALIGKKYKIPFINKFTDKIKIV